MHPIFLPLAAPPAGPPGGAFLLAILAFLLAQLASSVQEFIAKISGELHSWTLCNKPRWAPTLISYQPPSTMSGILANKHDLEFRSDLQVSIFIELASEVRAEGIQARVYCKQWSTRGSREMRREDGWWDRWRRKGRVLVEHPLHKYKVMQNGPCARAQPSSEQGASMTKPRDSREHVRLPPLRPTNKRCVIVRGTEGGTMVSSEDVELTTKSFTCLKNTTEG